MLDEGDLSHLGTEATSVLAPFPAPNFLPYAVPGSDPNLRGVLDLDAFAELSDALIIRQIVNRKSESQRARQQIEGEWRWLEGLYRQQTGERKGKQNWQSSIIFQEVFNKIETATSMFKSALLDAPEWFRLKRRLPETDEHQVRFIQRVMEIVVEDANFIDTYVACLKDALLLGTGCRYLAWEQWVDTSPHWVDVPLYQDPMQMQMAQMSGMPTTRRMISSDPRPRAGLRCYYRPIWSVHPDPYSSGPKDGKWFLDETEIDESDYYDAVLSGKFRRESLQDLGEPITSSYDQEHRYRLTRTEDSRANSKRKRPALLDYWGDLTGENGRVICKNWHVTLGNERVVARIGPNPHWSGFIPYTWSTPIPWEGRPWGRSIAIAAANKQEGVNKVANLMIDDFMYSVLRAFQIDTSAMPSIGSSDITSIEPGKAYKGRGADFIKQVGPFASNAQGGYPLITFLRQGIADDMRISEFQEGTPTSRGRPTKYEIQQKSGRGDALITNMGRDLERHDLQPDLRMAYEIYWQYGGDLSNPALKELVQAWLGPVEFLSEEMRLQMLAANFDIEVKGISGVFAREELFSKLSEAAPILQSMMPPPQVMTAFGYLLLQSLGLDPEHHLNMPKNAEEFMAWQYQIFLQQQAQLSTGGPPPVSGQARSAGAPAQANSQGGPASYPMQGGQQHPMQ